MGTNYYHRVNLCHECGRYDERHIVKSSCGWTFSFHGSRETDTGWNPMGAITSFGDWKERLKEGSIFNEYGEEVALDDFLKLVESKRKAENNHTVYCRTTHPEHASRDCWLDDEGNSFSESEFS